MPTEELFAQSPPFPDNVPIADIPVISYKGLQSNASDESQKLFNACREHGFFMLNLRDSEEGEALLKDAETIFKISNATFGLGQDELMKYVCNPPRDLRGKTETDRDLRYKQPGTLKTENGKFDAIEVYTLNQDDALGFEPNPHTNPPPLVENKASLQSFFHHAHSSICTVFSHLDTHLGLSPGTLSSTCPLHKRSATALRMLLTRPQPTINHRIAFAGHTDVGLITMLFNIIGGLQILPAGAENKNENWQYIKPRPGCALINLADTLMERTGGVLCSALHRVITPPGEQGGCERRSLAYLVRCEDEGSMRRLEGRGVPRLGEGEEDQERSVKEWAEWRVGQIMNGEVKPQTMGGKHLVGRVFRV
ncbi:2OG-Fe(II) oxygenase family protein [Rutstroemia sp. NJR-2017a WRK4]|nr:2OG-Fe(II) oxygenase family protein [Rutstroemia sp. NJR-2017a WRK4]PQE32320.1 2OG-Fe(II) oxygenase family protein [Rutstroemia sp. NJR-2017a WRK4]